MVTTLARLARFIIADLTDPRSIPQELDAIVPRLRVPVQPVIGSWQDPYALFADYDSLDYHWMLALFKYDDENHLIRSLREMVIAPAERKAEEIEARRQAAVI
jgi:hypothetical protein